MNDVLKKLKGGDRRSIGRVNEVVADVLNEPPLFGTLFSGLFSDDPVIRMRSADAIEKITAQHPDYLQPYKKRLLEHVAKIEQQEVRWHVAQMVPRLELLLRASNSLQYWEGHEVFSVVTGGRPLSFSRLISGGSRSSPDLSGENAEGARLPR